MESVTGNRRIHTRCPSQPPEILHRPFFPRRPTARPLTAHLRPSPPRPHSPLARIPKLLGTKRQGYARLRNRQEPRGAIHEQSILTHVGVDFYLSLPPPSPLAQPFWSHALSPDSFLLGGIPAPGQTLTVSHACPWSRRKPWGLRRLEGGLDSPSEGGARISPRRLFS